MNEERKVKNKITKVDHPADEPPSNILPLNPEALLIQAVQSNVPVETMERLLAMRTDLQAEKATAEFNWALAQFQSSIPAIPKRKMAKLQLKNGGSYSYQYADIADIQQAIAPQMKETGLSVTFDTKQTDNTLLVTCIVHHVAGHESYTSFPVPIDQRARMNDTQKMGAALTYGRRYALTAALGIVTDTEDSDAQGVEFNRSAPQKSPPVTISENQHKWLEARISDLGLDRNRVKSWIEKKWGVSTFPALTKYQHNALEVLLPKWAEQGKAQ